MCPPSATSRWPSSLPDSCPLGPELGQQKGKVSVLDREPQISSLSFPTSVGRWATSCLPRWPACDLPWGFMGSEWEEGGEFWSWPMSLGEVTISKRKDFYFR